MSAQGGCLLRGEGVCPDAGVSIQLVPAQAVSALGGGACLPRGVSAQEASAQGGVCPVRCLPRGVSPVGLTCVETLPCCNHVADGKNDYSNLKPVV